MEGARQLIAITLVLGLLWLALWSVKRKGLLGIRAGKSKRGSLEACGKLSLTPQHSIHLVRIGERRVTLAVHPAGISVLGDVAVGAHCENSKESQGVCTG
jgi:flagellar biogenesis protein FliO